MKIKLLTARTHWTHLLSPREAEKEAEGCSWKKVRADTLLRGARGIAGC
jgi:hypothetical protein